MTTPGDIFTTYIDDGTGTETPWEGFHRDGMYVTNLGRDLVELRNDTGATIYYSVDAGNGQCSMGFTHGIAVAAILAGREIAIAQLPTDQFNDQQGRAIIRMWADAAGTVQLADGGGGYVASVAGKVTRTSIV